MDYRFKLIVPLTYKDVVVESDEVELAEQEILQIRMLVSNSPSKKHGLMPLLKDGAPELYDKLQKAIEQPLRKVILDDGRKNGFVGDEDDDGGLDMDCIDYICQIPEFV